ncbi:hypothetical protein BOX15_Mlig004979g4 [Macrostomum lignano]|uniref:Uncharacterized protein n=1 Tax=Macrostomum lignano TaxID=282301 RepID=A0A267GY96_9PLAT|nr:hypothetical protein BOX15_Mlig004979g4 [Macrostomum lignano]
MGNSPSVRPSSVGGEGLRRLSACSSNGGCNDVGGDQTAAPAPVADRHRLQLAAADPRSPTGGIRRTPVAVPLGGALRSRWRAKLLADASRTPQFPGPFTAQDELQRSADCQLNTSVSGAAVHASYTFAEFASSTADSSVAATSTTTEPTENSLESSVRSDTELMTKNDSSRKTPLARIRASFRSFMGGSGGGGRPTAASSAPPKLARDQWHRRACRRRRVRSRNDGDGLCCDLYNNEQ